jgi:hypothetical protein
MCLKYTSVKREEEDPKDLPPKLQTETTKIPGNAILCLEFWLFGYLVISVSVISVWLVEFFFEPVRNE